MLLEALAMKLPVLVRDIPIYRKWLVDGISIYKAGTIDEFENKIKAVLEKKVPSLVETGYQVALERDLRKIGKQLAECTNAVFTS